MRRETYAALLSAFDEYITVSRDIETLRATIRSKGSSDRLREELRDLRERDEKVDRAVVALLVRVELMSERAVHLAASNVLQAMKGGAPAPNEKRDALINACRSELGVRGPLPKAGGR